MEIVSLITVTDVKTHASFQEAVFGCGQEAIKQLRKDYPKWTRFVLDGFEINGKFIPVMIR